MKLFSQFKKNIMNKIIYQKSFDMLIDITNKYLTNKKNDEKLLLLDYIITSLKVDICSSGIILPFIQQHTTPFNSPFPQKFIDENGNIKNYIKGTVEVKLSDTDIYVCTWNNERTFNNLLHLSKNDFKYDKLNHYSIFYEDINLCYVFNGNHSINAGRYLKKGTITSQKADLTLLYPHCYTDGIKWYNSHTNEILHNVEDFRLAALYEVAKKRYMLNKK